MFRSTPRKYHQDIRSPTVQSLSFRWNLKTGPWRHYPAMVMNFLSRLGLPRQRCTNNLDDESWNSTAIVEYEDRKWLVYLMVSIHLQCLLQVIDWSVKRKPVKTSPLLRIDETDFTLCLSQNITFKSSYNWFKIDIHQQLRPLTANFLAMFKVISTTIYT